MGKLLMYFNICGIKLFLNVQYGYYIIIGKVFNDGIEFVFEYR